MVGDIKYWLGIPLTQEVILPDGTVGYEMVQPKKQTNPSDPLIQDLREEQNEEGH